MTVARSARPARPTGPARATGSTGPARPAGPASAAQATHDDAATAATAAPVDAPKRARAAEPPDLRRRILDAAAALLHSEGVAALSMREVARRAGVTHQAPYHHFADRESILAELVTGGFDELADRLARANDGAARHGVRRALFDAGWAYVGFAMSRPGLFRIMFRPEIVDAARFPTTAAAGERAYGELGRLVTIVHGEATDTLASLHWSMVHGLASLMVDGGLCEKMPDEAAQRAHIDAVLGRFADMVVLETRAHRG